MESIKLVQIWMGSLDAKRAKQLDFLTRMRTKTKASLGVKTHSGFIWKHQRNIFLELKWYLQDSRNRKSEQVYIYWINLLYQTFICFPRSHCSSERSYKVLGYTNNRAICSNCMSLWQTCFSLFISLLDWKDDYFVISIEKIRWRNYLLQIKVTCTEQ